MTRASKPNLLEGPIWRLLVALALPALIGFIFNTLYNVVDVKFADWWPDPLAKSALSATFPPFFFQLGIGVGIYQASIALISNALGAGDPARAQHLIRQILTFCLVVGAGVSLIGLVGIDAVYRHIFGLEGDVLRWARAYMLVIFAGTPWLIFNFALYAVLSAHGNNRPFGISLVISFCFNWLLNWFFMFQLNMGVVGLAIATLLIQGPISSLYVSWELWRGGYMERPTWRDLRPNWTTQGTILAQAFPASLTMILVAVGIGVTQSFIERLGATQDIALAGFGAGTRLEQLLTLPVVGIGIGALSLFGQNYGAKRYDRVRRTLVVAGSAALIYSVFAALLMWFARVPLSGLLISPGQDPATNAAMAQMAQLYLSFTALLVPLFGVTLIATNFMVAIKRPAISAITAGARLVAVPLLLTPLVFRLRGGPDFDGIVWGYVTSSLLVFVIVLAYIFARVPHLLPRTTENKSHEPEEPASP